MLLSNTHAITPTLVIRLSVCDSRDRQEVGPKGVLQPDSPADGSPPRKQMEQFQVAAQPKSLLHASTYGSDHDPHQGQVYVPSKSHIPGDEVLAGGQPAHPGFVVGQRGE